MRGGTDGSDRSFERGGASARLHRSHQSDRLRAVAIIIYDNYPDNELWVERESLPKLGYRNIFAAFWPHIAKVGRP